MLEGVRVAATHGDCGLCVRMKPERRGRGRGRGLRRCDSCKKGDG